MRSKIKLNEQSGRTVAEVFDDFVFAQTAEGLSEVTIRNYKLHLHRLFGSQPNNSAVEVTIASWLLPLFLAFRNRHFAFSILQQALFHTILQEAAKLTIKSHSLCWTLKIRTLPGLGWVRIFCFLWGLDCRSNRHPAQSRKSSSCLGVISSTSHSLKRTSKETPTLPSSMALIWLLSISTSSAS